MRSCNIKKIWKITTSFNSTRGRKYPLQHEHYVYCKDHYEHAKEIVVATSMFKYIKHISLLSSIIKLILAVFLSLMTGYPNNCYFAGIACI
jgi:hypothetical protein